MRRLRRQRPVFGTLALTFLLTACDGAATAPDSTGSDAVVHRGTRGDPGAQLHEQLAALRRATARYHRFSAAEADEFVQITECMTNPPIGGMGFHYGRVDRLTDDAVLEVTEPEVLLYEPIDGRMRLVAVEYVVPFDILPPTADPPVLFGQRLHVNEDAQVWALHAWVWKHNPSGIFEDWNPRVSCPEN